MPRPKVTTTARGARGRERAMVADPVPFAIAAALDAIARHRASAGSAGEPLERAANDVARQRHLGPRERRAVGDLVFAWARQREAAERIIDEALAKSGGIKPNRRDRDLCALLVIQAAAGLDVDSRAAARLDPALAAVVEDVLARGLAPDPRQALPGWLGDAVRRSFPHDEAALMKALSVPAPLVLAVDAARASAGEIVDAVAGRGARAVPSPVVEGALRIEGRLSVGALAEHARDAVWPMDDGSQAVALALGAREHELVLDLCAGGGGKTRVLTTTRARVVSSDISFERLRAARSAHRIVSDGQLPAFRAGTFDRVLVDAPCTGTGTLRRAPDLAHRLRPDDVAGFQAVQKKLLAAALTLVKPGGLVVYATCSLLREENDDVVDAVLAAAPRAKLVPIPWGSRVKVDGSSGRARLTPHEHGTDGFFVAAMQVGI